MIATLSIIIYVLASFGAVGTPCLIKLYLKTLRQEKQIEHLRLKSLNQAIQIELMTEKRQKINDEVLSKMIEEFDRECLIFFNT